VSRRQHILSLDDAPFDKFREKDAWVIGVVTAGPSLLEGVMTTRVPVDGEGITRLLSVWIRECRFFRSLRAILFEGITMAGLSVIDLPELHESTGLPVISVHRKIPEPGRLEETLTQLGFKERLRAVAAAGPFHPFGSIAFTCAGATTEEATAILSACRGRSFLPEGIRMAHLIGQALILGESKGRA